MLDEERGNIGKEEDGYHDRRSKSRSWTEGLWGWSSTPEYSACPPLKISSQ